MSINSTSGAGGASYVTQTQETAPQTPVTGTDHTTLSDTERLMLVARNGKADAAIKAPSFSSANVSSAAQTLANMTEGEVSSDIYTVMLLFQKMAQEQRNAAREVRTSEMQSQVGALQDAAGKIRDAAQERFVGAVVQGSMQIAGGVASIGAGAVSLTRSLSATKSLESSASLERQAGTATADAGALEGAAKADKLTKAATLTEQSKVAKGTADDKAAGAAFASATGQGSSGILGGIGTIVQATQEKKAAEFDAQKAELEAQAKVHDSAVQQANDLMQQMMDVIRDVRDKLSAMDQSRLETARGISRNI